MAKIEIRAKAVNEYSQHLYIVYTFNDGTQGFFRGQPEGNNNIGALFGHLEVVSGLYVRGSADYDELGTHIKSETPLWTGTDSEMQIRINTMQQEMNRINVERYDYNLAILETLLPHTKWALFNNQNSNTVAHYLAEAAGLGSEVDKFILEKNLNVPGYSSELIHVENDRTPESLMQAIRESGTTFFRFMDAIGYPITLQSLAIGDTHNLARDRSLNRTIPSVLYDDQQPGRKVGMRGIGVNDTFEIQVEQQSLPWNRQVSANTAVAMALANSTLQISLQPRNIICSTDKNDNIYASDTNNNLIYGGKDLGSVGFSSNGSVVLTGKGGNYSPSVGYFIKNTTAPYYNETVPIYGGVLWADVRNTPLGASFNMSSNARPFVN